MRVPAPLLLDILAVAVGLEYLDSKFVEYLRQRFEKNPGELEAAKALKKCADSNPYAGEFVYEEFVKKLLADARKEGVKIDW